MTLVAPWRRSLGVRRHRCRWKSPLVYAAFTWVHRLRQAAAAGDSGWRRIDWTCGAWVVAGMISSAAFMAARRNSRQRTILCCSVDMAVIGFLSCKAWAEMCDVIWIWTTTSLWWRQRFQAIYTFWREYWWYFQMQCVDVDVIVRWHDVLYAAVHWCVLRVPYAVAHALFWRTELRARQRPINLQ